MSKRRKTSRRSKVPIPRVAKRGFPGALVAFLAMAILVSVGFWWWMFKPADKPPATQPLNEASATDPTSPGSNPEFDKLKGGWRRPDGGYVLAIKSIAGSGAMDAAYFNPNPIHVAKAAASHDGAGTKVFIELRDVNYPGSTYTLTYDSASDQLKGIYFQAVEGRRFEVVFERIK